MPRETRSPPWIAVGVSSSYSPKTIASITSRSGSGDVRTPPSLLQLRGDEHAPRVPSVEEGTQTQGITRRASRHAVRHDCGERPTHPRRGDVSPSTMRFEIYAGRDGGGVLLGAGRVRVPAPRRCRGCRRTPLRDRRPTRWWRDHDIGRDAERGVPDRDGEPGAPLWGAAASIRSTAPGIGAADGMTSAREPIANRRSGGPGKAKGAAGSLRPSHFR